MVLRSRAWLVVAALSLAAGGELGPRGVELASQPGGSLLRDQCIMHAGVDASCDALG